MQGRSGRFPYTVISISLSSSLGIHTRSRLGLPWIRLPVSLRHISLHRRPGASRLLLGSASALSWTAGLYVFCACRPARSCPFRSRSSACRRSPLVLGRSSLPLYRSSPGCPFCGCSAGFLNALGLPGRSLSRSGMSSSGRSACRLPGPPLAVGVCFPLSVNLRSRAAPVSSGRSARSLGFLLSGSCSVCLLLLSRPVLFRLCRFLRIGRRFLRSLFQGFWRLFFRFLRRLSCLLRLF